MLEPVRVPGISVIDVGASGRAPDRTVNGELGGPSRGLRAVTTNE